MTTESKIYWGVGIVSALLLLGAYFMPGQPAHERDVPWHVEHPTADTVRIFGLTLGQSNTNDAELRFREEAKPSLFRSPGGKMMAEIFFEQVDLAGLRARIVLTIAVPDAMLEGMYERGLRMASTGTGKKITLTPEDITTLRTLPISSLTYLPDLRVVEPVFLKRFGPPAQRIREKPNGLVHWLYPQDGLDITLSNEDKPVLQFVSPRDFDKLSRPLLASGEVLQ